MTARKIIKQFPVKLQQNGVFTCALHHLSQLFQTLPLILLCKYISHRKLSKPKFCPKCGFENAEPTQKIDIPSQSLLVGFRNAYHFYFIFHGITNSNNKKQRTDYLLEVLYNVCMFPGSSASTENSTEQNRQEPNDSIPDENASETREKSPATPMKNYENSATTRIIRRGLVSERKPLALIPHVSFFSAKKHTAKNYRKVAS